MKKTTIAVSVGALLIIGAIIAFAQMSHKGGFFKHHEDLAKHHEQMIDRISEKLKLSDRQKTQAEKILADA